MQLITRWTQKKSRSSNKTNKILKIITSAKIPTLVAWWWVAKAFKEGMSHKCKLTPVVVSNSWTSISKCSSSKTKWWAISLDSNNQGSSLFWIKLLIHSSNHLNYKWTRKEEWRWCISNSSNSNKSLWWCNNNNNSRTPLMEWSKLPHSRKILQLLTLRRNGWEGSEKECDVDLAQWRWCEIIKNIYEYYVCCLTRSIYCHNL